MTLGIILAALPIAVWGSGTANCPALVQLTSLVNKVDEGTAEVQPGAAPSLAMQHAKTTIGSSDWLLQRAEHHASSRNRLLQARDAASQALDAVKHLESSTTGVRSNIAMLQNATLHAGASADINRTLDSLESNEARALCRACAEADVVLLGKLQSARDLHTTAQNKALAMAEAAQRHEASATEFGVSLDSFEDSMKQLQEFRVTYKSSDADFDELIQWATSLKSKAQEAVGDETDKIAHEKALKEAHGTYNDSAAAAQHADEEVAANTMVAEEACAGLGLAPLKVELPPAEKLQYLDYDGFEVFWPNTYSATSRADFLKSGWDQEKFITGINFRHSNDFLVMKDSVKRPFENFEWYYTYNDCRGCWIDIYGSNTATTRDGDWIKVAKAEWKGLVQGPVKLQSVTVLDSTPYQYWKLVWVKNTCGGHGPLAGWFKHASE